MKKKCFLLACTLILSTLAAGCSSTQEPVTVTASPVKTEAGLSGMVYSGTVRAETSAEVAPSITGKIVSLNVKEGQAVSKGTVLFTLDSSEIQLQVNQAEASLNAANVALSNAAASSNSGSSVIPAQTAYSDAVSNLERIQALYEQGAISQVDYENAKSKVDTAQAQVTAAQLAQQSAYNSAAAQVGTAQAALDTARQKLSDCVITAPISGQIAQVNVETGSIVSPQSPAMTVIDNSSLKASIDVLERDIDKVFLGMPAEITVQSIGESCTGTVTEIAPAGNEKTGMFQVYVALGQENSQIRAGMTADVTLLDSASTSAGTSGSALSLFIPSKSIHQEQEEFYVFLLEGSSVKRQAVTLGKEKNEYTQITSGLKEDSRVVVKSSEDLKDGAQVQVLKDN